MALRTTSRSWTCFEEYIFPAEAKTVSPELVRVGTRLAALETIQSGTTTFADMYYFEEEVANKVAAMGAMNRATEQEDDESHEKTLVKRFAKK